MELTPIEKYFIERFENQEKELAELKKAKKESDQDIVIQKVLKSYYYTHFYAWRIDKNNYFNYLKAYNEKDIQWLKKYDCDIYMDTWNLELIINNELFRLHYDSDGRAERLVVVSPDPDNNFSTREAAEKYLLEKLKKGLDEFATKNPDVLSDTLKEEKVNE